jgi:hypothetical protein
VGVQDSKMFVLSSRTLATRLCSACCRYLVVGAVKQRGKLLQPARDGSLQPVDLIAEYKKNLVAPDPTTADPSNSLPSSVKHQVDQLWTYMAITGVEFGWLSCWNCTWLAWRPLHHPEDLLVSGACLWLGPCGPCM